jgi:preprotein translocase subunit YajC
MPPFATLALFAPSEQNSALQFPITLVLIFGIMYFMFFAPQSKQRKQLEAMLNNLKKGDEVVTAGGIIGEVIHVKEGTKDGQPTRTMEDRVTIKSGESRLVVERGRIARVVTRTADTTAV